MTTDTGWEQLLPRLGFGAGQIVQEFGWDDDCDETLRGALEQFVGSPLEDESFREVADAAVLWFRADEEDLADVIVDALASLADGGPILVLTPKTGRPGAVDAADVQEAARTTGLTVTGAGALSDEWSASRLVAPKSARR